MSPTDWYWGIVAYLVIGALFWGYCDNWEPQVEHFGYALVWPLGVVFMVLVWIAGGCRI
jgi:hypothetical protein